MIMNKEQFIKIKESIIKLKEDLGRRQMQLILYGSGALLLVLVLILGYRPLILKLRVADRELKGLSVQLISQRDGVATLRSLDPNVRLMQQKELSQAIDKITGKGRAIGLKFSSITPGEAQKSAYGDLQVLPIAFQIECSYKDLGRSLAYLEQFPQSIAEVKSFSIRPRAEIFPNLSVELLLNLYMEAEDGKK